MGRISSKATSSKATSNKTTSNKDTNKPKRKRGSKSLSASPDRVKLGVLQLPMNDISITQISGELIGSSWLLSVKIQGDGEIKFDNSWTELIVNLMGMLFEKDPYKFMATLIKYGVLSEGLSVMNEIPLYPEISGIRYELYKLNSYSNYYIEFRRQYDDYAVAIRQLLMAVGIPGSKVRFSARPIQIINGASEDETLVKITDEQNILELLEGNRNNSYYLDFKAISIMETRQSINSIHQALYVFLTWLGGVYGKEQVIKVAIHNNFDEAGLTTAAFIDKYDTRFKTSKIWDNYIYTSENVNTIIKYIANIASQIGLSPMLITLTFDTLKLKEN